MSQLILLDHSEGDKRYDWNPKDPDRVKEVKKIFQEKLSEGWAAFKMQGEEKGVQVKRFDEEAEKILLVPPMQGG